MSALQSPGLDSLAAVASTALVPQTSDLLALSCSFPGCSMKCADSKVLRAHMSKAHNAAYKEKGLPTETPTPTRFLDACADAMGHDPMNVNPFEASFKTANGSHGPGPAVDRKMPMLAQGVTAPNDSDNKPFFLMGPPPLHSDMSTVSSGSGGSGSGDSHDAPYAQQMEMQTVNVDLTVPRATRKVTRGSTQPQQEFQLQPAPERAPGVNVASRNRRGKGERGAGKTVSSKGTAAYTAAVANSTEALKAKAQAEAALIPYTDEKKRTGRKRMYDDETQLDEKRRRFLEKNRAAASRCRAKKKAWVNGLEDRAKALVTQNKQFLEEVLGLRNELTQLKNIITMLVELPGAPPINRELLQPLPPLRRELEEVLLLECPDEM